MKQTETRADNAEARLRSYMIYRRLFDGSIKDRKPLDDEMSLRAEMFMIRRSVMRLPDSQEKLFLYNHYIRGETMEACAELLAISRRSIFRLKIRALRIYLENNPPDEKVTVI